MCEPKIFIKKFDPGHFKEYSIESLIFMLKVVDDYPPDCDECSADSPKSVCPFRAFNLRLPKSVLEHPDSPFYQKMVMTNPEVLTEDYVNRVDDEAGIIIAELSDSGEWVQGFTSSTYLEEIRKVEGDPGVIWKKLEEDIYYDGGNFCPCEVFSFGAISRAYVKHAAEVLKVSIVPKIEVKKDILKDLALLCISRWADPYSLYGGREPKCKGCLLKIEKDKDNDYFECVGYQMACKLIEVGKLPNKKQLRGI